MSLRIFWCFILFGLFHGVTSQCTSSGRFANDIADNCRGYTTCIATGGSFYQYDLACPPNFIYNHYDSQCTNATTYHCLSNHNCTEIGAVAYEQSEDCTAFIVCIQGLTGITARLVDCPINTVFSPMENYCVDNTQYTCPKTMTTQVFTSVDASETSSTRSDTTHETDSHNSAYSKPASSLFSFIIMCCVLYLL